MGTVWGMELFDPELYSLMMESQEELAPHDDLESFDSLTKRLWLVRPN